MSYKDPDKQKKYQREWRRKFYQKRRLKIINLLGGKCLRCNNDDFRVLEIDHIEPILRDRSQLSMKSGSNLYDEVSMHKIGKSEVQLLCANCHRIKTFEDRLKYKNYIF